MKWCLDKSQVGRKKSILEIMGERLQTLPQDVRAVLQVASCLGAGFHERLLCVVLSPFNVPAALNSALEEDMISIEEETGVWKFTNDQMQEAAYALIPVVCRPLLHHTVGQRLLQELLADTKVGETIGQIVSQLSWQSTKWGVQALGSIA
jgi:predicted ATPase